MLEKILNTLDFAYRQKGAIYRLSDMAKNLFAGGFSIKKISALFIAFIEMFSCVIFDGGLTPLGPELDLEKSGYQLVYCDDFNGDSLNLNDWSYRGSGKRRGGYNGESQVEVKDGNLIITGEYLKDGAYGEGWYVGMVNLKKYYRRGYFECRSIINSGNDFWSAFWFQADRPYDHYLSNGGLSGAELDIMESMSSEDPQILQRGCITQTIHCNGGDSDIENIDSCMLGRFKGNDIYNEYNTYGVEWTEDEYIFYINGIETARSTWSKGVSDVPEMLIVSLEIPESISYDKDSGYKTQFITDYVKIWQKPEDIGNEDASPASVQKPTAKGDILALYNDATAGVAESKPGYRKAEATEVSDFTLEGLAKISGVKDKIGESLGKGSCTTTIPAGTFDASEFMVSKLEESDISSAVCDISPDNKNYLVALTLKVDKDTGASAIDKFTNDYKNKDAVNAAITDAGANAESVNVKGKFIEIFAKIDIETNQLVSLDYGIKMTADVTNLKSSVLTSDTATISYHTDIAYTDFDYNKAA